LEFYVSLRYGLVHADSR